MRKQLIAVSIFCICLFASACGSNTTGTEQGAEDTVIVQETEMQETETIEVETEVTEISTEVSENKAYPEVNPENVDPKTTQMDGDTQTALAHAEGEEIDAKYGSDSAWTEYAKSQGADNTLGWCWIYYTGQGAGNQESYAVYMKEDSPRYGEVFHLGDYLPGGDFFVGYTNEEYGIADNRRLLRMSENGELGEGTTVTQDENGQIHIVIE